MAECPPGFRPLAGGLRDYLAELLGAPTVCKRRRGKVTGALHRVLGNGSAVEIIAPIYPGRYAYAALLIRSTRGDYGGAAIIVSNSRSSEVYPVFLEPLSSLDKLPSLMHRVLLCAEKAARLDTVPLPPGAQRIDIIDQGTPVARLKVFYADASAIPVAEKLLGYPMRIRRWKHVRVYPLASLACRYVVSEHSG